MPFGAAHYLILLAIAALSVAAALAVRGNPAWRRPMCVMLALVLAVNEVTWYVYRLASEGVRLPEGLPLQLCDLAVWLAVVSALTLRPAVVELGYYGGVGGSTMALLMPDLWTPFPSYSAIYYFVAHGLVVITMVMLTAGGMAPPRPGSVWRAYWMLGAYAATVGVFNAVFGTNYMYLCRKPAGASLLDVFGPWPAYVGVAAVVALGVFWLLWLPFRSLARK